MPFVRILAAAMSGILLTGGQSSGPSEPSRMRQVASLTESQCEKAVVSEEVRIGRLDGSERYVFAQVVDLAAGPYGSVYVADAHPPSVRLFDQEGRFVRQLGGVGEGPGEYRLIRGLSMLPNGSVAVWDFGNRRISIYDSAGAYSRQIRVPSGSFGRKAFTTDTAGRFYVRARIGNVRTSREGFIEGSGEAYLKISPAGRVLDTLAIESEDTNRSFQTSTGTGLTLHPFVHRRLYAISSHGFMVVGSNKDYSLKVRHPKFPKQIVRDDHTRVTVVSEERDQWKALAQYMESRSGRSFPAIPDKKPALRELWTDQEGRIWVRRHVGAAERDLPEDRTTRSGGTRPNITWREPADFDVYSSNGEFLWCVRLPWKARVLSSRGPDVWGIESGDYDEDYVIRWGLP